MGWGPFGLPPEAQCCCDGQICCPGRCFPDEVCDNPLPTTLNIQFTDPSTEGCFSITGTLTLNTPYSERTWSGIGLTGTCTWCGVDYTMKFDCFLTCNATSGWILSFDFNADSGDCGNIPPDTVLNFSACDPILLSGDIDCFACPLLICEDEGSPPLPYPHDPFCLSVLIWET